MANSYQGHNRGTLDNKKPSSLGKEGLWKNAIRLDADNIGGLEAFGAFQQIKFHGLALIERTVAILLNGGKMNEDILPGWTLNKTVTLRPVKPLHCAFFSHKETPFASAKIDSGVSPETLRCKRSGWGHRSRTEWSFQFAGCTWATTKGSRVLRRRWKVRHKAPEPVLHCGSLDCQTRETSTRSLYIAAGLPASTEDNIEELTRLARYISRLMTHSQRRYFFRRLHWLLAIRDWHRRILFPSSGELTPLNSCHQLTGAGKDGSTVCRKEKPQRGAKLASS